VTLDGEGNLILANPDGIDSPSRGTAGELDANGSGTLIMNGDDETGLVAPFAGAQTGPLSVDGGAVYVGEGAAPDGTLQVNGALNLSVLADLVFYVDQPGTAASADYYIVIAEAIATLSTSTSKAITVKLPAAGTQLLKKETTQRVRALATFTPTHAPAVGVTRVLTLKG
jgi:hypothetical protein